VSLSRRACPPSHKSTTLSLMLPIKNRFCATHWFSNLDHNVPGVSSSSKPSPRRIHCFPRVTPGLFPVTALFLPLKRFMMLDLPELGTPIIIILTGLTTPFCLKRKTFFISSESNAFTTCFAHPFSFAFKAIALSPFEAKYASHLSVVFSSARSDLFNRNTHGFFSVY